MKRETEITPKTKVPLSILASAIMVTASVVGFGYTIRRDIADLKHHMETDWVFIDQANWTSRFAAANPTLKIPDPGETFRNNRPPGRPANNQ